MRVQGYVVYRYLLYATSKKHTCAIVSADIKVVGIGKYRRGIACCKLPFQQGIYIYLPKPIVTYSR